MDKLSIFSRPLFKLSTSVTKHIGKLTAVASLLALSHSVVAAEDGSLQWKTFIGASYNNPALDQHGTIYIGSQDHNLYAVNPDGSVKWTFKTLDTIASSSPAIHNDTVYIGSKDGHLYAVDFDGSEKWRFTVNSPIYSTISVTANNDIILSTHEDGVYCLDEQGNQIWHFQPEGALLGTAAVDNQGNIFFADGNSYVYSLTPAGTMRWKFNAHGIFKFSGIAIDSEQNIYVGNSHRYLYSLTNTGLLRWLYDAQKEIDSEPVILANGQVAFGSSNTYLQIVDQNSGQFVWRHQVSSDGYIWRASPTVRADGTILVGGYSKKMVALQPKGEPLWEFEAQDKIFSSPAIASDGSIYFSSQDGYLYALNGDSKLANTPWPKAGRNNQNNGLAINLETPIPTEPSIDWEFDTTAEVRSAPEVSPEGQIYVGSKEGSVFSLNPDGTEAWRFFTGSTVQAQPTWYANNIFVGSNNGNFYALNAEGKYLWSQQTGGSISAKATVSVEQVIVGSLDGYIYSFDRRSGALLWKFQTGAPVKTAVYFDNETGNLYAVSDNNKLFAFDPEGNLRWDYQLPSRPMTTPVLDDLKTIYVATYDGTFYAFDQGGMLEWSHKAANKLAYQELVMVDDILYAVGYDKHLTAVKAWGNTLWRKNFEAFMTGSVRVGEDAASEKYLVVTDYAGKVTRMDKHGSIQWQLTLPTKIATSPAITPEFAHVIVSGLDGKIYSLSKD